ncbi:MAG: ABC transporter ATP-binding protein [Cyclobacteriaceae bacterium]|jgi:iron complex transport system ATP-binding protein|nr:ABC transporter ATP-binding protein [Cyclobacteriaceae bacterium]
MMHPTPLLTTQGLSVGYGTGNTARVVLANLHVALHPGKLICFMGPNGIGKSTLLRTLAGLQKPLAGDITHHTPNINEGQRVAVVLTDRVQAPNMTARELVAFGRYPYLPWHLQPTREDESKIDDAIARAHIRPWADQPVTSLSDGQLQMTMIARAIAQDTPILLLDEPTAHLDLNNRVETMTLLRALAHQTHKAVLLATHELDLALQMADEIWLITQQRTLTRGIPEDLVLDGSFDAVFQLKGFDLRTGRITHAIHRTKKISLLGEGPVFLWTKNALEREGYEVTAHEGSQVRVGNNQWFADGRQFDRLHLLLQHLHG